MYTYKLQCPKCGSKDVTLTEDKIYHQVSKTKKNAWLSKRKYINKIPIGSNSYWYTCNKCDYKETMGDGSNFVIDCKKI